MQTDSVLHGAFLLSELQIEAEIAKVNVSLGLVMGYAIVCEEDGQPYYDRQGDHIPESAMLKASLDFMEYSQRVAREMHSGDRTGTVVFAFPLTEEVAEALDIDARKTGLIIAMKPDADMFEKFRSGELTGFSIGGSRILDEEVADAE